MKIVFGTTNKRKIEDLQNIIDEMHLDIQVLSMDDIGWDLGDIVEDGATIEENSLIKAQAIDSFCKEHDLKYPIITDDTGLFVDVLNGEPGVYTARYGYDEMAINPDLPKYQGVVKLLRKLQNEKNRKASYKCCVTLLMPDGTCYQEMGESKGTIAKEIIGELKRPYFYSVFILDGTNVDFHSLTKEELDDTFRYDALKKSLRRL